MGAIRMLAQAELRRRWRGSVVAVLLVGLVGAVTLGALAGARRGSTSLRRFNDAAHSSNIEVQVGSYTPGQLAALARTPGVEGVGVVDLLFVGPASPALQHLEIAARVDESLGTVVDRPRLIAGRLTNPTRADEINIGEGLAATSHLRIGDTIDALSMSVQTFDAISHGGAFRLDGPRFRFHIVGIVRRPLDLATLGGAGGVVLLTPAFDRAYRGRIANPAGYTIRVRASNVAQVNAAVDQIFGKDPNFQPQSLAPESSGARDAINVLTDALLIFAAVAAVAGLVAITIVLTRELDSSQPDQSALLALGATRSQRAAMNGLRVGIIAIAGASLAIIGAIAASPLLPFGVARRADPDPGFHADWQVLLLGTLLLVAAVVAVGLIAALRSTRIAKRDDKARQSALGARIASALTSIGLSPAATTGCRMATEPGRDEHAVPIRSAAFGAAFGVFGLSALIVFASSLGHLSSTPSLYGWTFDFKAETTNFQGCDGRDNGVSRMPGVASLAVACYENMQFAGRPTIGWGLVPVKGTVVPALVAGRAPQTPNEVALGAATMRAVGKHIGDTVQTAGPNGRPVVERIVGEALFPQLGDAQPVADGVWFTSAGWYAAGANNDQVGRFVVGTYAPHADRALLAREIGATKGMNPVGDPIVPTEVDRLRNINWFPTLTAILLALLALIAVAHAIVTSTRRRRRDLAVLKTIGFARAQVRHTVEWQATALTAVGVVVGLPLGVLAGAVIWRAIARSLGVRVIVSMPWGLALLPPAVAVAAIVTAFFPARAAARRRPAIFLRAE